MTHEHEVACLCEQGRDQKWKSRGVAQSLPRGVAPIFVPIFVTNSKIGSPVLDDMNRGRPSWSRWQSPTISDYLERVDRATDVNQKVDKIILVHPVF